MAITAAVGERITAAKYNQLVPYYLRQGTDQNLTTVSANSNTFAALAFDVNQVWAMDFFLDYGGFSVATNNVQLSWSATGGLTGDRLMSVGVAGGSGSVVDTNGNFASRVFTTSVSYSGTASTSVRGAARQSFVITTTTAGTMTLALIMSAGTGIAYAGSYITGRRVG